MGVQRDKDQRDLMRVVPPPGRAEPVVSRGTPWRYFRPVIPKSDKKLTSRELEVLRCFAEGLGTEAIAARLTISRTTVRNHTQRILAKLEVHTRLAAVAKGYCTGMIAIPGTS
jgi:DNA-binding NarL/FixJ family response regulator